MGQWLPQRGQPAVLVGHLAGVANGLRSEHDVVVPVKQDRGPRVHDQSDRAGQEILSVDPHATVLAYSWIDDSATPTNIDPKQPAAIPEQGWKSEGYTTMNGLRMAEAITEALAPGYSGGLGKVHLMGHSHGARVATVAALGCKRPRRRIPRTPSSASLHFSTRPRTTATLPAARILIRSTVKTRRTMTGSISRSSRRLLARSPSLEWP